MLTWLLEVAWVLQHSTRTQLSLVTAFVSFFGMLLLGHHMASGIEFSGPLAALTDSFREADLPPTAVPTKPPQIRRRRWSFLSRYMHAARMYAQPHYAMPPVSAKTVALLRHLTSEPQASHTLKFIM